MQSSGQPNPDPKQVKDKLDLFRFMAVMARKDINSFIEFVMTDEKGHLLKQSAPHEEVINFISRNRFGVIEVHREFGKTTLMIAVIAWLIGNNPDVRIKVVCSSDNIATARGKAIRDLVEAKMFKAVFPRIRQGREWTDAKFSVVRNIISPESTLECFGVQSRATGGRCDWLFLDDVDDEEVVSSEAKRTRNWERVSNVWLNLLTPDGKAFSLSTPWHEKDTTNRLRGQGWPVMRKPVINMVPVWPERWGVKELKERKAQIGSLAFARGFELVPINSETAPIKGPWVKTFESLPRLTALGIAVDPNNSMSDKADFTAMGAFAVTYDFKVYLLDVIREHFEFPSLMIALVRFATNIEARYKMSPVIGVESTAYQKAIPQQLKIETKFPIIGIHADKSKFIRASRLAVHIENGRVHLRGGKGPHGIDPTQEIVYDELVHFPASAHDDCVDMMGYGVELMLGLARKSGAAVG